MSNLAIDRFGRIACYLQNTEQKNIANGKKKNLRATFCILISYQKLCAKTEKKCRNRQTKKSKADLITKVELHALRYSLHRRNCVRKGDSKNATKNFEMIFGGGASPLPMMLCQFRPVSLNSRKTCWIKRAAYLNR